MKIKNHFKIKNLPLSAGANFFIGIVVLLNTLSCKKEEILNMDVLPNGNLINSFYTDTLTLLTTTKFADDLNTDKKVIGNNILLGTFNDPVFGKSTISLYTQLSLQDTIVVGQNPIIDSVVLGLVFTDTNRYGNKSTISNQLFSVYQVTEDFNATATYFNTTHLDTSSIDLVLNPTQKPNPNSKVNVVFGVPKSGSLQQNYNVLVKPHLRIKLDPNFGTTILNNETIFKSDNDLKQFLKGIYITTNKTASLLSGEGNYFKYNLTDSLSGLFVYYHSDNKPKIKVFSFKNSNYYSRTDYDYNDANNSLKDQLNGTSSEQNKNVFLQSLSNIGVSIKMPYLSKMLDSGDIIINRAELVIKPNRQEFQVGYDTLPPEKLSLRYLDNSNNWQTLPDKVYNSAYFGGYYKSSKSIYTFNIARYLQQLLIGNIKNNELILTIENSTLIPSAIVVGGGEKGNNLSMKLNILATKTP